MNARHYRILVLEADEQVLNEVQVLVEDAGFEAEAVWEMAEALQLAASRHFDLLLVGDHPPQVSAGEVLRDLQCRRISIPCVVLQTGPAFLPEYLDSLGATAVIRDWRRLGVWLQEWFAARRNAASG